MADADFSGVMNPGRVIKKRMDEAEDSPKPAGAASGAMAQSKFSGYDKDDPDDIKAKKAKALAEALRGRK